MLRRLLSWRVRLRNLVRRRALEQEMDAELRFHLDQEVAERVARGMPRDEAIRMARAAFGNVTLVRDQARDAWGWSWLDDLLRDLRLSVRTLLRSPAFTLTAIVTLALGIGANAAVFSVVDPLLLRALPVPAPDRLVLLHSAGTHQVTDIAERAALDRYAAERTVIEGVTGDAGIRSLRASFRGQPSDVAANAVSSNYFEVLGVRPRAGRLFTRGDGAGDGAVVVLGSGYWTRAFGADPAVLNASLEIDGRPYTIAGVAPAGFEGLARGATPDVYLPLDSLARPPAWVHIVARLRSGVTLEAARTLLDPAFRDVAAASAIPPIEREQAMSRLLVTSISRGYADVRARVGAAATAIGGVVALVLLAAIANLGGLVLARAVGRTRDIAVQLAFGASARDITRRFVMESAVIAAIGTLAGLVCARGASRLIVEWLARSGVSVEAGLSPRLLLFAAALAWIAVLGCGVLPGMTVLRANVAQALRSSAAQIHGGRGTRRLREALVLGQIAASVTLVAGTGLLLHSVRNLYAAGVGFDPDRVLAVSLTDTAPGRPAGQSDRVMHEIVEAAGRLPGVESAAIAGRRPLDPGVVGVNVVASDGGAGTPEPVHTLLNVATAGYFETLGIPLVAGAGCAAAGGAAPASPTPAIANERLARRLFGDADPLQRPVRTVEGDRAIVIIGVAADAVYSSVREDPYHVLYLCRQPGAAFVAGTLFVRSAGARAGALAPEVAQVLQTTAPGVEPAAVQTLGEHLRASLAGDRLVATLFSGFAGLVVAMAVVGLYGVLASLVSVRQSEIAVRIALGATARDVARIVAAPTARLMAAGLVLGGAGALAMPVVLGPLLFGVAGSFPLISLETIAALVAAAALACSVPLRRALRTDPVAALRAE